MSPLKRHLPSPGIPAFGIRNRTAVTLGLALAGFTVLSLQPTRAQTPAPQTPLPQTPAPATGTQGDTLPIKPLPVPTGVIPLPQGPPPTGPQFPVPSPAQPLPRADQPLNASPNLNAVTGYVQDRAITQQEAVALALYASRDFARAVAELQQAQGRLGQARSALNPVVSANANLTEYDAPTTANFGAILGGGQSGSGSAASIPPVTITPQFFPVLTATLALPLDVAGVLRAAISQAQFQEVAARIDVNRIRNEVVYNVKNAFYNVLRAQAQIAVATDTVNNALSRLNDANKNYAAGTAPRFDVISAQRDVANAQQDLINARAQLSVNLAALKNAIGLGLQTRLRISDQNAVEYPPGVLPPTVPPIGPNGLPTGTGANPAGLPIAPPNPIDTPQPQPAPDIIPNGTNGANGAKSGNGITLLTPPGGTDNVEDTFTFGPEFDSLLQEALRTRPEILEGDAQIAAARKGVQYARRSQLPSVNLSLSDSYQPDPAAFNRSNVGAVTLGVTVPLFDGGLARARVREARGVAANAEVNRRSSVDQVQVDVQQAYIALVQSRSRVAVANVGLAQAREAYRLARVRYNAGVSQQTGVSPQLELSNAQSTLAQAQSNQINALYDYNNARAQIDRAAGRFSFTAGPPGYPAPPSPSVRGVR